MSDELIRVCTFWVPRNAALACVNDVDAVYYRDCFRTILRPETTGMETVVDVGAKIGCFTRLWHERNRAARLIAVEDDVRFLPALGRNVGSFAKVLSGYRDLGEFREEADLSRIDVLKIDVGGREISFLHSGDLSAVGTIFLKTYDTRQWAYTRQALFDGWDIGHMLQSDEIGIWHLVNPRSGALRHAR